MLLKGHRTVYIFLLISPNIIGGCKFKACGNHKNTTQIHCFILYFLEKPGNKQSNQHMVTGDNLLDEVKSCQGVCIPPSAINAF